jgi:hypothetical protein
MSLLLAGVEINFFGLKTARVERKRTRRRGVLALKVACPVPLRTPEVSQVAGELSVRKGFTYREAVVVERVGCEPFCAEDGE